MRTIVLGLLAVSVEAAAQPDPTPPPAPTPDQPAPAPDAPAPAPPARPRGETIHTSGRVIDKLGHPVRDAKVGREGDDARVKTDRGGRYSIDAPVGSTLVIEHDGLEVGLAIVNGVILDDVVLLDVDETTETIELSGEAPAAAPGATTIDRNDLQRVPGTGGDIVKALTVMPGVVNLQIPLGYSGVVIRGSSPQDSKVLVDDFEIPVLFHNIGFRAVLPAESIATLEYIPGGFDVSFGRASSGIVALTTRPGDEKRSTQAEISAIDGGLLAQGPIGKKSRYMFGLRRSTIDLLLPQIIPADVDLSLTTVPSYYDEQFRIDTELDDKWKLSLSSVGTIDTFELYATKDTDAATKRFYNRTDFIRLTGAAKYHDGPWTANLALSGLLPEFVFEAGLLQKINVTQPMVTPRVEIIDAQKSWGGLSNVEWKIGTEAQISRSTIDLALPVEIREGEQMQQYDPKDIAVIFHGSFWIPDFAQWTSLAANFDERTRVTIGMRADEFARSGEVTFQPRGKLEYKISPTLTARLSSGAFRRPPEFQSELLQDNLEAERSTQNIVGLQYEPREGTRIQASTYYTDRTHLITHEMDGTLGNNGRGRTVGAELLATFREGPWFGWLSYSYSHSTRIDHPGEPERLFTYDQPHSMNAAASWKRGHWQFGGRFQLYSGLPYTQAHGAVFDSDRDIYVPLFDAPNSSRAPMHHQLDLRVDYSWKWGPTLMTAFVDVQNVYMNDSVVTYFYGYDYSQQAAFKSLPIIPSLGLRGVL